MCCEKFPDTEKNNSGIEKGKKKLTEGQSRLGPETLRLLQH